MSAVTLAHYLGERRRIGPTDVVVGHSMGGGIAARLTAEVGASAVLLSSFTNPALK